MQRKLEIAVEDHEKPTRRSSWGDFFVPRTGWLTLADGTVFHGTTPKQQTTSLLGEVVFNTGMTGYVESLSDPSYAGQILVFTYPLMGNYGVDLRQLESVKIQASGVVMSEVTTGWSYAKADRSLVEWLQQQDVPFITDVDTRALTKHLRESGTMIGAIGTKPVNLKNVKLEKKLVSIPAPVIYNKSHRKKVILVDCGAKENIVRSLCGFPIQVKRVPFNYDYTKEDYNGVVFSNGPGDPTDYGETIAIAKKAIKIGKPLFGICLGNQILALAAGAKTYKLKYGHRGHNQPCLEVNTKHAYITSQNHGYAIDGDSLPRGWRVSFANLNDGSVEGIEHISKPFFSVQFHPEANPGPTDTKELFERFYKKL